MALITCPECGGSVSDKAQTCPHCGYQITTTQTLQTTVSTVDSTIYTSIDHNGYDVMLVDYMKSKLYTVAKVQEVIDCSFLEATNLLGNLPCYLYNDLSYDDALYIAQSLQYYGMRVAIYDPNGTVTYYAPSGYNRPLPSLLNVLRKPLFFKAPVRHHEFVVRRQAVRPKNDHPVRNNRPHMSMPMPNQPSKSSFKHEETNRHQNASKAPQNNNRGGGMENRQEHSMGRNSKSSNDRGPSKRGR